MYTNQAVNPPARPAKQAARLRLPAGAFLAALLGMLPAQAAWAQCTARMPNINFGDIKWPSSQSIELQTQVTVTCNRTTASSDTAQTFNVCLAVDGGRGDRTTIVDQMNPRNMCPGNTCQNTQSATRLSYNLYTDPAHSMIWTTGRRAGVGTPLTTAITIPANSASKVESIPIYAKLTLPATYMPKGAYGASFDGGSTSFVVNPTSVGQCGSSTQRFPFSVRANIIANCTISEAGDIDFGSVNTAAANLQGQSSFKVTCNQNTPYAIGLLPSNSNNEGQGQMSSTDSGNTDTITYQLRSQAGMNGRIWGNNTSLQNVGNGVWGTGTGAAETHHVYATVGALGNYRAGAYRDRVIINVNY